jgi:hypothetical protein
MNEDESIIRDIFAAAIIQGRLASIPDKYTYYDADRRRQLSEGAFLFADAMMEARGK